MSVRTDQKSRVTLQYPEGTDIDPRTVRALTASDVVDIVDKAARLLGIIYGDQGQLLQRPTTKDLLVQLRSGGAEIDPRQIRALTSADVVSAIQSGNWDLMYDILMVTNKIDEIDYTWNADGTLNTKVYKKSMATVLTLTYTWNPDGTLNKVVRT
jgi:hypothetical protein